MVPSSSIINETRISLYVNGTLEGRAQLSEPIFISGDKLQLTTSDVMVSDSDLVLGAYLSTTRGESKLSKHFSGLIDEVFIYKEALTELQIQEIYSHFIEQLEPKLEPVLLLPIELQNTTSTLSHNEIVIGTPVNWIQTIVLNETNENNIQVELPADAENIQAEIITSIDQSFEIPPENLQVTESLLESADLVPLEIVTMEKINEILQDNKDTKFVLINESSSEYLLEFETPAPYTIEEDYSNDDVFNKTVTVAHDSALHYTDIKSYSDIPEDLVEESMEFNLFWDINGTITDVTFDPRFQIEFIDTNGNGIVDKMQWIIPQLSQQIFQIIAFKNILHDGINIRVSHSFDDAEQKENGNMDLDDKSDLDIAENQIGLRFKNINIPQGSTITRAYIQFTAENNNEKDSTSVDIFAENTDNAKTFSKSKFDITNRKKTQTSVEWYIPEWKKEGSAGTAQRTPDISILVQEIVNREGWSKGNSIAFMLLINNHGDRDALTYDGNPQKSARLHIEFSDNPTCDDDLINGKGYWKTHSEHLESILELGPIDLGDTTVITIEQAMSILNNASAKDAKDSLRSQLLTTILNLKNGANPMITGHDINKVVEDSISFLESHTESVKSGHPDRKKALALKDKLESFNEKDDFNCPKSHKIEFSEKLEFQNDKVETSKRTALKQELIETLLLADIADATKTRAFTETFTERLILQETSFITRVDGAIHLDLEETLLLADRTDTSRDLTVQLEETLHLADRTDTSRDLTVQLEETLHLADRTDTSRDLTVQLDDTLHLADRADATKTRAFTETFTERLTLQETSFITRVNGAIHLDLDETLHLADRTDTSRDLTVQLEETLHLADRTDTSRDLTVQLEETLHLADRTDTSRDLTAQLEETLHLADRTDTSRDLTVQLDEELTLEETEFNFQRNLGIELDEMLDFADSAVGLQNLKSNQILVDPLKSYYIINKNNIQLVFTQCDVALRWVFIEDGAQNAQLNYSQILKKLEAHNTVEICNPLTVNADIVDDDDITDAVVDFVDSTIVTGSLIYNGNIILPTVTLITIPSKIESTSITSGSTTTTTTITTTYSTILAIELGNVTEQLTFNKPVRIEFPDQPNNGFIG